jgi:hypothetical protein
MLVTDAKKLASSVEADGHVLGLRGKQLESCVISPWIVCRVLDLAQIETLPQTALRLDLWPGKCTP